jgi:uncharacterized protein
MKLLNEFTIDAPIEQAWPILLDLDRVARCLPGVVTEPGGEDGVYRGEMKLKLGPMVMHYAGSARMATVDEATHTAQIEVQARERKGQGSVTAAITNRLEEVGGRTRVTAETELAVTGRAAQFGRGIMQDVAERMLAEFAERFERELRSTGTAGPSVPDDTVLDVGRLASGPLARRAAIAAGALAVGAVVVILARRRR